jgi:hypothetical protein
MRFWGSRVSVGLLTVLALCLAGAPAVAKAAASAMDVVLVVDTSGSMAWDVEGRKRRDPGFTGPARIDRVVDALERYARKLPDGTRLRLISFNTGVKTNREFLVSPSTRDPLISAIGALKAEVNTGDTWLWEAMREGIRAAEVYAATDPDLTVTLYVLTDGEYDNKTPAANLSLGRVLGASSKLGGDALYASLVLLGKPRSQGGSFSDNYLAQLKREAGERCDVQMDEDFDPLFPPILEVLPEKVVPREKVSVIENSAMQFARVEWSVNGSPAGTQKNLVFTPPKFGRYEITFKGFDRSGRRARARKVLNVGLEPVRAVPRLAIDGKPFGPDVIATRGQTLALTHESLGPVARAAWTVNGQKTEAAALNRVLDTVGEQTITLTVESAPGPGGEITRSTSQPIVFQVIAQRVKALVDITVNGVPIDSVETLYAGDTLQLQSRSTGPVKAAVWTVNGKPIAGNTVQWPIESPGDIRVRLKVSDPELGQTDESDIVNLVARKRPPTWTLWALGIAELGLLAFFAWLLTGNGARDSVLLAGGGGRTPAGRYFSRIHKTATIPLSRLLPRNPYWRKKVDSEAVVISRNPVASGPAVKLGCTFSNARGGDVLFGEAHSKPATNTERYYTLEDARDPENPQTIEFTLRSAKRSFGDSVTLAVISVALIAAFFWFYLRIYPSL